MPYINKTQRAELHSVGNLDAIIEELLRTENNEGALNYVISTLLSRIVQTDCNYATINKLIGVLECAKLELYRRIAVPYEDSKLNVNGDVY